MEQSKILVLDIGSARTRAGFAGNDTPRCTFPSVVGKLRNTSITNIPSQYAGDEALSKRGILRLTYPVERGAINNWADMEILWRYTFEKELRVKIGEEEVEVFLIVPTLTPKSHREQITQIMFETFQVSSFFMAEQAVTALLAYGVKSGVVLESGEGVTQAIPIHNGVVQHDAITRLDIGGADLTDYLFNALKDEYQLDTSDRPIIADIKERLCYVPLDYEKELEAFTDGKVYELPGGSIIRAGIERVKCPEAMFKPSLIGLEKPGVVELVHGAIMKTDKDMHNELYGNIVLAGGNLAFPGFAERLQKELAALASSDMLPKVHAIPKVQHAAWIGGAKAATMDLGWISNLQYCNEGPHLVHRQSIF